jgi:hypothetical protein
MHPKPKHRYAVVAEFASGPDIKRTVVARNAGDAAEIVERELKTNGTPGRKRAEWFSVTKKGVAYPSRPRSSTPKAERDRGL